MKLLSYRTVSLKEENLLKPIEVRRDGKFAGKLKLQSGNFSSRLPGKLQHYGCCRIVSQFPRQQNHKLHQFHLNTNYDVNNESFLLLI